VVQAALDAVERAVTEAVASGDVDAAADMVHRVMARAAESRDAVVGRMYAAAVGRMLTAPLLQGMAALLPRRPVRYHLYLDLIDRAGAAGAEAVMAQLGGAPSIAERRLYFDALRTLEAAVPALLALLGDARWHVARNAAELLGLLGAYEAEPHLAALLRHDDARVRRAAALALTRLGTASGQERVREQLQRGERQLGGRG
jgi:hypothetical protein